METARETLQITTQQGIRQAVRPLTRRYRTDTMSMKIRRLRATVYTDTGFINIKSLKQKTCYQGYSCENFIHIDPLRDRKEAGDSLFRFAKDVGAPAELISDNASELLGFNSTFAKQARFLHIRQSGCETKTQRQNRFELETGILKRQWKSRMATNRAAKRLWDFCLVYEARILSMIARGKDGIPGIEKVTGDTVDITEWLDFSFYDLVWFWDDPKEPATLGRWLGVSHRIGSALCYWVIKKNGYIEARTTVQHVTDDDAAQPETKSLIEEFDIELNKRLDDTNFQLKDGEDVYPEDDILSAENENRGWHETEYDGENEMKDRDDYADGAYDQLIDAQVLLPNESGDGHIRGTVLRRAVNHMNEPIGKRHKHVGHDTRKYVVRLSDGTEKELQHNYIALNMFAQADSEGRQFMLLKEIISFRRLNNAVHKDDGFIQSKNGNRHRKKTTRGWEFLVKWKDGSQDWVSLKDMKDSNPLETAEFAIASNIHEEPAFAWWVNDVLKTRERIINKVKSRYWKQTHKFGIRVPKSVREALDIDERNGNDFWATAIDKEMKTVNVAYEKYEHPTLGEVSPEDIHRNPQKYLIGYKEITCHLIFDIKLDGNFTCKARFVADGSKTEAPKSLTYSSVVSRDSVRIAFLAASLNDLELSACDISGAYLNAPCGEKVWFQAGDECGENAGKAMMVTKALYGLKSSAKAWRTFFSASLETLGFKSCEADPDVFMKKECDSSGRPYWSYMLVYVDDCLLLNHDPNPIMEKLKKMYKMKGDAYGTPDRYLGANVTQFSLTTGTFWCMYAGDYVRKSCKMVKEWSNEEGRRWTKK